MKEYVSKCHGAVLKYYSNVFIPLSNGETEGWVCSKCHKPCEVVAKEEEK